MLNWWPVGQSYVLQEAVLDVWVEQGSSDRDEVSEAGAESWSDYTQYWRVRLDVLRSKVAIILQSGTGSRKTQLL